MKRGRGSSLVGSLFYWKGLFGLARRRGRRLLNPVLFHPARAASNQLTNLTLLQPNTVASQSRAGAVAFDHARAGTCMRGVCRTPPRARKKNLRRCFRGTGTLTLGIKKFAHDLAPPGRQCYQILVRNRIPNVRGHCQSGQYKKMIDTRSVREYSPARHQKLATFSTLRSVFRNL